MPSLGTVSLKDLWDWPNNSANGYMASSGNWSGDNSFGMDKRINDLISGNYLGWPNLHPVNDLGMTVDTANTAIAKYKFHLDSFNSDEFLTFYKLYVYPIIEATMRSKSGTSNYEIDTLTIKMPGAQIYSYKNSSNVTVFGADFVGTSYWKENNSQSSSTEIVTAPTATVSLNGSGYLAGITLDTRGEFTNSTSRLFTIQSKADEYVAPTTYAEDVWDTDDEWANTEFSLSKLWPQHVAPSTAKIFTNQPSQVTRSQDGTKYVRSSGVITQRMEVVYPPMTYEDFREFEAVAQLAKGQEGPFYFRVKSIDSPGRNILFFRTDSKKDNHGLASPFTLRLRNTTTVGDKTILVEGFPGARDDVFVKGEYLIFNGAGYGNGDLVQVINDNVASNIYGEAKIRLPYGVRTASSASTTLFKQISHVIVSLSDDAFEYTVGTDGLYRLTVGFDLDEFK